MSIGEFSTGNTESEWSPHLNYLLSAKEPYA